MNLSFKTTVAAEIFGMTSIFGAFAPTAADAQTELPLHTFVPPGHIIYTQILEPLAADPSLRGTRTRHGYVEAA